MRLLIPGGLLFAVLPGRHLLLPVTGTLLYPTIDFAGWKKVDAYERAEGAKEGREHKKVIDPEQMRALAHA